MAYGFDDDYPFLDKAIAELDDADDTEKPLAKQSIEEFDEFFRSCEGLT